MQVVDNIRAFSVRPGNNGAFDVREEKSFLDAVKDELNPRGDD